MKTIKFSIISIFFLMTLSITAQAAQLATAKVVNVKGTVTAYYADGTKAPLKSGDILREGDSVSVTALSKAELVFSNGSELTVDENTSVNIATLQQEAFSGNQSYEQLQADPSKSQTLLELNYGKLSGHVKKLNSGSKFHVQTPLGTAAIRGTKWNMTLIYNEERKEFLLTVNNVDGAVDIISNYLGSIEYGQGNVGDKGYDSSLSEATEEAIPKNHTVVMRIQRGDPGFDDLFKLIKNFIPTGPKPVITPGPSPDPDDDEDDDDDDFGIIVVSPEV